MTKEVGCVALDKEEEKEDDINNKEEETMKVVLKILELVCAKPIIPLHKHNTLKFAILKETPHQCTMSDPSKENDH